MTGSKCLTFLKANSFGELMEKVVVRKIESGRADWQFHFFLEITFSGNVYRGALLNVFN